MSIVIPVILCGGSGTRLWPISREQKPKQFLKLLGDKSLLQNTLERACRITGAKADQVVSVTLQDMVGELIEQYKEMDEGFSKHVLGEPEARNTAPAVALAAEYCAKVFGDDAILWVLPSDHFIGDEAALEAAFEKAKKAAEKDYLVTFGITPTRPETGYGYIKAANEIDDSVHEIDCFVEKPDAKTALEYLNSGDYSWNSGMFVFKASSVIDAYKKYSPSIYKTVSASFICGDKDVCGIDHRYSKAESTPFDIAIMEKTDKAAVVFTNPAWSDIGSWESLREMGDQDEDGNVTRGDVHLEGCRKVIAYGEDRLIGCVSLENLVIVDTKDALLVADQSDGAALKKLINKLKSEGRKEMVLPAE